MVRTKKIVFKKFRFSNEQKNSIKDHHQLKVEIADGQKAPWTLYLSYTCVDSLVIKRASVYESCPFSCSKK